LTPASVIAIDGPAASGKSTVAEKLARELGYLYLDTGVMYRAVTLAALRRLGGTDDEQAVSKIAEEVQIDFRPATVNDGRSGDILLDGEDVTWEVRSAEVEAHVSPVSAYRGVRVAMTEQQRRIGKQGCIIMVGRDIGTVVLPDAELKIYLDASVEERARRRHLELLARGKELSFEEVLSSMVNRDQIDSSRALAPLKPAEDAILIDSEGLSAAEVADRVCAMIMAINPGRSCSAG